MERDTTLNNIVHQVPSPCYLVDTALLRRNLEMLQQVKRRSDCKILLALKAFSMWGVFDLIKPYLDGTCASSINEARLGAQEIGGEVHVFCPAWQDREIEPLGQLADHVIFNSLAQFERFGKTLLVINRGIQLGLRINPAHSEAPAALYDPCAPGSHLGILAQDMPRKLPGEITGLHFHTLCEQNSDALERTLAAVEKNFGPYLEQVQWFNFGGGHHITRDDYNIDLLCQLVSGFKDRYGVEIYLEPGEAVALNTGYLIATVLDIVHNQIDIAILDTSATAHMPDVLEMPYRPNIEGAGKPGERPYTFRLAGRTCLAGDVIGDYSFDHPLKPGERLIFHDMAHYTMVKNTTFNGIPLPDIVICDSTGNTFHIQRKFNYDDFKMRLS
ncbi:MAG: carboxynorspermidine decarboxylase [Sedimentisphaerales bacterium]|nr:carboxynorspermidine decarboxylase [Sedimentisphaerales bacterium]